MKFADGAEADRILSFEGNPSSITIAEQEVSGITIGGSYNFVACRNAYAGYGVESGITIVFNVIRETVKVGESPVMISYNHQNIKATVNVTAIEMPDKSYLKPWASYTSDGNVMKFLAEFRGSPIGGLVFGVGSASTSSNEETFIYGGTVPIERGNDWVRDALKTGNLGESPVSYDSPISVLHRWTVSGETSSYVYTKKRNPRVGSSDFVDRYGMRMYGSPYVKEILEYGGGPRVDYNQYSVFPAFHDIPIGPTEH